MKNLNTYISEALIKNHIKMIPPFNDINSKGFTEEEIKYISDELKKLDDNNELLIEITSGNRTIGLFNANDRYNNVKITITKSPPTNSHEGIIIRRQRKSGWANSSSILKEFEFSRQGVDDALNWFRQYFKKKGSIGKAIS